MPKTITRAQLVAARACEDQVALFDSHFPKGEARVTVKRAIALASVFDWGWAAAKLLAAGSQRTYIAAIAEAEDTYIAARAEAWRPYAAAIAEAEDTYIAATAEARRTYDAATEEARRAYDAATAEAFARAYLSQ